MKSLLTLILIAAFALSTMAQQRIDGSFAFQTNPAKKYSIYVCLLSLKSEVFCVRGRARGGSRTSNGKD